MKYTEDEFELVLEFLEEQDNILRTNNYEAVDDGWKDKETAEGEEWAMETAIEMIRYMQANKDFI